MKRLVERLRARLESDSYYRGLKRDVRRKGWAAVPICDQAEQMFWTYTIGFDETLSHPEIVTSGASHRLTVELLGRVFDAVKRGELIVDDAMPWAVAGHGRYVWRRVHWTRMTADWFLMAMYRRWERTGSSLGLTAFQLVRPDDAGILPWEPGYADELSAHEPQLWLPQRNSEVAAGPGL